MQRRHLPKLRAGQRYSKKYSGIQISRYICWKPKIQILRYICRWRNGIFQRYFCKYAKKVFRNTDTGIQILKYFFLVRKRGPGEYSVDRASRPSPFGIIRSDELQRHSETTLICGYISFISFGPSRRVQHIADCGVKGCSLMTWCLVVFNGVTAQ